MEEVRDHHVLVPHAERAALLVAGASGRALLPVVRGRPGAAGVLEGLRAELGLVIPYLRPAQLLRDADGKAVAALHELDAPAASWEPPDGLTWLALDAADPAALAEPELGLAIAKWLEYQRGQPLPGARPPWARPGWLASASDWIAQSCDALELEPRGQIEVVEQWPLSSVLRLQTSGGRIYFKAAFAVFLHEPAVTVALASHHADLVTEPLAVDEARGWLLMRELRGTQLGEQDVERWVDGLRAIARVHRAWAGRRAELLELGAVDRSLASLSAGLPGLLAAVELDDDLRARLDAVAPELEARSAALAEGRLPETLIHGDLHPWNLMADGKEVRVFDWSDACVAHPLFDLATFLPRADNVDARHALREAYLGAWSDLAPIAELRDLAELAAPLAQVHHAQSYLRILDALEPDDRWFFADVPRSLLLDAVERLEVAP